LGRWAWQHLRPATADGISAAELLGALASLDKYEAAALAKQCFESRPLADACDQLLQLAATTAPAQRISVVDLIASLGEVTTSAWRAALAAPNLGAHAAAVLSQWGTGPKPPGRQEAWLATEYALATLARDGVEDATYEVRDHGGLAALDAGAHPDLAVLRRAIDEFTGSGVRERVFQLKIALVGVRPAVWRRVLIPASATLGDLHRVIQVVLAWDNDHLHMFTTEFGRYADPYYELDDCDDEDAIRLSRVLTRAGAQISYLYDFGGQLEPHHHPGEHRSTRDNADAPGLHSGTRRRAGRGLGSRQRRAGHHPVRPRPPQPPPRHARQRRDNRLSSTVVNAVR
jgi:Plasmid pRiA4b ORF-3-like protein